MQLEKQRGPRIEELPTGIPGGLVKRYLLEDKEISHWLKTQLPPQRCPIGGVRNRSLDPRSTQSDGFCDR